MAFTLSISYDNQIESPKSLADVAKYLTDYAKAIPQCFPGIESFTETSPRTFNWKFAKLSFGGHEGQIGLTTRFEAEPTKITMHPVPGAGIASLAGYWNLESKGSGCKVSFHWKIEIEVPLPGLMRGMIAPKAEKELRKVFDRYAQNLNTALA